MHSRDTEVTSGDEATLFQQIRKLYRHAPITNHLFATLAPDVALTLSPRDPIEAFPLMMDLVEEVENDRDRRALIACLGLGQETGGVRDRKVWLNENVHPRTVSRWADDAIRSILPTILDRYSLAFARVFVRISSGANGGIRVRCHYQSDGVEMDAPIVTSFPDDQPRPQSRELVLDPDIESHRVWRDSRDVQLGRWLSVEWNGPLDPVVEVTYVGALPAGVQASCRADAGAFEVSVLDMR